MAAPFRWAITSAGKIAADFAHAVRQLPGHEVVAVAARREADAAAFVARHAAGARTYGGYDAMFSDGCGGADACYVATQPDTHAALVGRLLDAGTPALCEKPLAVDPAEVEALYAAAAAKACFLMEGMWTRCFPATVAARALLERGAIGEVVAVQAEFGYDISNGCPASVRGDAATGGMAGDIGVYLAEKALLAFGPADFDRVDARGTAVLGARDGVDLSVAAAARFAPRAPADRRGGVASLLWTGQCDTPETATFLGTTGSICFDAAAHTPTRFVVKSRASRTAATEEVREFPLPADDGAHAWNYPGSIALQYEAEAVARAVRGGALEAPEWTHADSRAAHGLVAAVRAGLKPAGGAHAAALAADVQRDKPGDFAF